MTIFAEVVEFQDELELTVLVGPGDVLEVEAEASTVVVEVTEAYVATGPAGGVLAGNYPNPGFAQPMATQAELDDEAAARAAEDAAQFDALAVEELARSQADAVLSGALDGEAVARANADAALSGAIDAEEVARVAADLAHAEEEDPHPQYRQDIDTAGLVTLDTAQTITGLKTLPPPAAYGTFLRSGDARFASGPMFAALTEGAEFINGQWIARTTAPTLAIVANDGLSVWSDNAQVDVAYGPTMRFNANASEVRSTVPLVAQTSLVVGHPNPAYVPMTVYGAAAQTAPLQEWRDSANAVLAALHVNGYFTVNKLLAGTQMGASYRDLLTGAAIVAGYNSESALQLSTVGAASPITLHTQDWYERMYVGADGGIILNRLNRNAVGVVPLTVRGSASQSASLQTWQNSAAAAVLAVAPDGSIGTSDWLLYNGATRDANTAVGAITASGATIRPLVLRGAAAQSANLQEWQDSAGAILARLAPDGGFWTDGIASRSAGPGGLNSYISLITNVGIIAVGVNTVPFFVRGASGQVANLQDWRTNTDATLLVVTNNGTIGNADWAAYAGADRDFHSTVGIFLSPAAGIRPLVLRGHAAQTANLQEWQNSAATSLAVLSAAGNLEFMATGRGPILRSPNDTRYRITVDNAGALAAVAA